MHKFKSFFLKVDFALDNYTIYQLVDKLKRKFFYYWNNIKKRFLSHFAKTGVATTATNADEVIGEIKLGPSIAYEEKNFDLIMSIPFTGRYEVLEFVIDEFFKASDSRTLLGVCLVGSTVDDGLFAEKMKSKYDYISYQECPNYPIGRKAQLSLDMTSLVNCKVTLMNGSDDVVSADYVKSCIEYVGLGGVDFIAPIVWYTYNAAPKSIRYGSIWRTHYTGIRGGASLGAGRAYSKEFLELIDYDVFATKQDMHLDAKMGKMAAKGLIRTVHPSRDDGPIVSIKGDWDKINDIETLIDDCPTVNFLDVEFETSYDMSIVRSIRAGFSGLPSK